MKTEKLSVLTFQTPLVEGLILRRKNRFIMEVEVEGIAFVCHCPSTEGIGGIVCKNIPCLLSKSANPNRKTAYTVEAISLDSVDSLEKTWVGINQNAANRYVENCLAKHLFSPMLIGDYKIKREQFLGKSKIDFLIESATKTTVTNTYLEVKTPLTEIQLPHGEHIKILKKKSSQDSSRFIKHITELSNSLKEGERAILLTCFLYDNPSFTVHISSEKSRIVKGIVQNAIGKGLEIWQVNFELTATEVKLLRLFETSSNFLDGGSALR